MGDYEFYTECFQTDWEWWSQYDKSDEGHVIRVMADDIPDFIAEQVAKFTRYISANLVPVVTRKDCDDDFVDEEEKWWLIHRSSRR